jgi:lipoprotein-anchoring transpeptidase ErfK/SrfK
MASKRFRTSVVGLASTALIGASIVVGASEASAVPSACKTGRVICVNKSTRQLALMVNGRTQIVLDARFGSVRRGLPTRDGMYRVYWKDANHVSSLYGSAMPYAMFFSGGQAIHFSSDFVRNGYNGASHGCINTRSLSGTRALFNAVRTGDKVYIHY